MDGVETQQELQDTKWDGTSHVGRVSTTPKSPGIGKAGHGLCRSLAI